MNSGFRHPLLITMMLAALLAANAAAAATDAETDATLWTRIRHNLFGERTIHDAPEHIIGLDAPQRAQDAALVPLAIHVGMAQQPDHYVKTIWLIIDRNPSPVAGIFHFTPASGRADIDTRVRVDAYTNIHAIAELSDGSLYMVKRYVKASGGCSAPAGTARAIVLRNLGKMKFRLLEPHATFNQPNQVLLMVSHPNDSGLAVNQLTHYAIPPYYVHKLAVTYSGKPILTAEINFSISENPNFRFYFTPRAGGTLKAEVFDTRGKQFNDELAIASDGTANATPANAGAAADPATR
jgi:sulfur-oxidizing protein SoxY